MVSRTIRIVRCVVPSPAMSVRGWAPEPDVVAPRVIRATDVEEYPRRESSTGDRAAALTGLRAVAAMMIIGTHAAYGTGQLTHGFLGALYARLEIGVPIFFVSPGSCCSARGCGRPRRGPPPLVRRYALVAWAYRAGLCRVVLVAYAMYQFRDAGPNPGHTWMGLLEHLTLTQIYRRSTSS